MSGESKKGIGVLLCLFLGILGLIIGLLLYPSNTVERETFISGWLTGLLWSIVIGVIIAIIICLPICTALI